MAATRTGEDKCLGLLEKVHAFTYRTFVDRIDDNGGKAGPGGGRVVRVCNRGFSRVHLRDEGNYCDAWYSTVLCT